LRQKYVKCIGLV